MLILEELINKVSLLKRNCFASVFEKYFEYQQAGNDKEEYAVINYREDETLYVSNIAHRNEMNIVCFK